MNDDEFNQILQRTYAQVVLNALLDAERNSYAFNALQDEVNAIVDDDSRGAKEMKNSGKYAPGSLSSLLSAAEDAGLVTQYLSDDGRKRWRLDTEQLSELQIDKIKSRNSANIEHADVASMDRYWQSHTDSRS